MGSSSTWSRVAWGGIAATLLGLGSICFSASASIRNSVEVVAQSSALAAAYTRADEAVVAEVSLERKYRVLPSAAVRDSYVQQRNILDIALDEIHRTGSAADRDLVAELRAAHTAYDAAIRRMFDAVDHGDTELVVSLESAEVEPAFERMDELIDDAADEHTDAATEAVENLRRVERLMFVTISVGFAVGITLIVTFALVMRRYQRALLRQARNSEHAAMHDALTGLPNRALFNDRLEQALAAGRRSGSSLAVMLLDLDRFKEVNDTLGHHYGDLLLRNVAGRVREALREVDTVARLSGDEFAVLLPGADAAAAVEVAERVLRGLHRSFVLDDVTIDIEASIGVASAPTHAGTAKEIVRCADLAMYTAKDAKTGVVMYEPASLVHQPSRLLLLGELRRALEEPDEIVLHYQPKVDLQLDTLCGVEALVRWNHPTRGMVSPAEFIPIAESTGLINRLTAHVLRMAVHQARAWLDGGREVQVAVNLSPRCLLDTTLLGRVRDLLDECRLPARLLRLEVTEGAIIANPALALTILTGLHELGVRLSIDDYGTGYSSMAYLKRLPVDELKVDRSFVMSMVDNDSDAILVRSAIDLGHNLGLTVVAEGVERSDHVSALHELGCDIAQGFHYARPMPPADITAWIHRNGERENRRVPGPATASR